MTDYSKGKIYKIVCNVTGDVYIGSTVEKTLAQRLTKHRYDYKSYLQGKDRGYCSSFKILANNNYSIYLIEIYPCKSRDELKSRERFYIEGNICVNKRIPGRTKKEWDEANKEHLSEYHKQHYQSNDQKIKQRVKQYRDTHKEQLSKKYNCNCGGHYKHTNRTVHFKSKLHKNWLQINNEEQNKIDIKITENDT